ncbi:MAG: PDZ domain-containing protein [Syntrophobacteraceae bacterium]|nr:PDZ domain-containing protein [Syntrophobacteraceae bacterium]
MKKHRPFRKYLLTVLAASLTLVLAAIMQNRGAIASVNDTYQNLEVFSNVLSLIQKNYVEDVDTSEVLQGAIKGMLASLDPHSSYMKPDDFKELKMETKGSFDGIGIEITTKDSVLTVVSPIEGTPGDRAGLKAGDKILRIGKDLTKDMTLTEAVKKLRGPKGTEVTIFVHRTGWSEMKEFTIVRDVIPLHSVKSKILEAGYIYLRVTNFQDNTTKDFKDALKELSERGRIRGLVIDLRNNPGGLLAQSVKISDIFIDEGLIVSTKGRVKEQNTEYSARVDGEKHDYPVVVLVNEGSASASEIVAGALQDHKKALIVGTSTFGKGSVQTIIPMSNGAGLRLTTARYYTPSGRSIQAKGIEPDIIVENTVVPEEVVEPPKKKDGKPQFLKEKDLRNHITDSGKADELEKGAEPAAKSTDKDKDNAEAKPQKERTPLEKAEDEAKEIKEKLAKDNQLRTALMILKGLTVYSEFKKVPPPVVAK